MPGYPTRVIRSSFGPRRVNPRPVEHPESEVGAEHYNPAFHQIAGLNLATVGRASVIAEWDSGSAQFVIGHQEEAWNSERDQARPLLERTAAGSYTYTFASTYKDEDGTDVATELKGVRVTAQKVLTAFADRIDAYAWIDSGDPLKIQIRLYDAAGAGEDAPFWLEVG